MNRESRPTLTLREWVISWAAIGFFLSLADITVATRYPKRSRTYTCSTESQAIKVVIKGAVIKPGEHLCRPGTHVKTLLKSAGLKKNANKRSPVLKKILYSSQTIEIEAK